jgi:hypothetical protein
MLILLTGSCPLLRGEWESSGLDARLIDARVLKRGQTYVRGGRSVALPHALVE